MSVLALGYKTMGLENHRRLPEIAVKSLAIWKYLVRLKEESIYVDVLT